MNTPISLPQIAVKAAGAGSGKFPVRTVVAEHRPVQNGLVKANPGPDLQQLLNNSAKYFRQHQQHLGFSVDKSSGRLVVSVIDSKTSEVIRQIPTAEALEISRRLQRLVDENSASDGLLVQKSV